MKVSCICPTTIRRKQFWPDVLKCFIGQTVASKELIFIADTSDEITTLADVGAAITPGLTITVVIGGDTLGDKRNIGCRAATGDIVAHLDDDDLYAPEHLKTLMALLEHTGKALTGYTDATVHEMRTVSILSAGVWRKPSGWWKMHSEPLMGGSLCYRKDWWSQHPFESVNLAEDTFFIEEASKHSQCVADINGIENYCIRNHHFNTSGRCITDDCVEIANGGKWE
jgi:glycosyltransferase involved in cell wall biosynthesis